jgi:hypothetical protein
MSINVYFEGQRKVVKVASPNMVMQDIIEECASHFSTDPKKCSLKYKRNKIANSQLFRFSNIPYNGTVDLVLDEKVNKLVPVTKLAFSIQDIGNVTKTFKDSNMTLFEILETLVSDGDIPSDIVESDPELIYVRNSYSNESLKTTTLASMGLTG